MALEFALRREHPAEIDCDCVIVGLFDERQLTEAAAAIDARSEGRLMRLIESGDVSGKPGRSALLLGLEGVKAPRVLVVVDDVDVEVLDEAHGPRREHVRLPVQGGHVEAVRQPHQLHALAA